jgi:hypothetical protein
MTMFFLPLAPRFMFEGGDDEEDSALEKAKEDRQLLEARDQIKARSVVRRFEIEK